MTDVYISRANINGVEWHAFTVSGVGGHDVLRWETLCALMDPVEAMHVLRRRFAGYVLHGDHRHIHIQDQATAIAFGVWLFELFERERCEVTAKFMSQTYEEVLEEQSLRHVYIDYQAIGEPGVMRVFKILK